MRGLIRFSVPGSRLPSGVVRGLIVAGIVMAQPAWGDQSAGLMSPFAHGAGARGLGMGGAVVAETDDASALVWNPGGLGRVSRFCLEANYTRLDEAGTGEHFAALAIPNWKWGTIGLSVRHLGIGGIERRDERDIRQPGDFSAGETELAAGYGRMVVPGLGLGGSIKVQRSEVGALAGSGFGVDLGCSGELRPLVGERLRWLAPMSFGIAVRNAVRPSQRLDLESVPDPRLLRLGLAWHHDLTGPMDLTLASSVDQARVQPAEFHLGAEVGFGGMFALRTGVGDGHLTAGTSVRWAGLAIDYAYEERDLGAVHHIGLSKNLGKTVSESREAARAAQEAALADRVKQEYELRLAAQVSALVDQARSATDAGQFEEAIDAITAARALAPGDARLAPLEADILRGEGQRLEKAGDLAGAALSFGKALEASPGDSLSEAGRKRAQAGLAQLASRSRHAREMDIAYGLFAGGDLLGAATAFQRLHETAPNDSAIEAMLSRVRAMVSSRIASHLDKVRRDLDGGLLDEAERDLDEARELGAPPSDLTPLSVAIDQRRQRIRDQRAPATSVSPVVEATAAQKAEASRYYHLGLERYSARQTDMAVRLWEIALSLDPSQSGASAALVREYLLRGMAAFGRGQFAEAEKQWARAVQLDPSDARARTYLQRARVQMERTRELTGTSK